MCCMALLLLLSLCAKGTRNNTIIMASVAGNRTDSVLYCFRSGPSGATWARDWAKRARMNVTEAKKVEVCYNPKGPVKLSPFTDEGVPGVVCDGSVYVVSSKAANAAVAAAAAAAEC